jgi:peptidoglycan/xylan/chitin deacetylase (PgdA/CDA1 family)
MVPFLRCLSILIYHRVVAEPDPLLPDEVCVSDFDWHLSALARWFRVIPLSEAVARLRSGTLPARAACVTFDDGYADNVSAALPLLRKHGIPATFFVATGFLDGGRMWNDTVIEIVRRASESTLDASPVGLGRLDLATLDQRRRSLDKLLGALKYLPIEERQRRADELGASTVRELPSRLMMTTDDVAYLHKNGMEIGAHTVHHPILAKLDLANARNEIRQSKARLEAITGSTVSLFAYPNGKPGLDYRREHVEIVKQTGFVAAVSTARGVARAGTDPHQLPRFTPWDRTPGKFLLRLAQNALSTKAVEQV